MAHYAFIDEDNVVVWVITGRDEDDLDALPEGFASWEAYYGHKRGMTCLRTSYNTIDGEHVLGGTPFRENYAATGYTYDPDLDAFIRPESIPVPEFDPGYSVE